MARDESVGHAGTADPVRGVDTSGGPTAASSDGVDEALKTRTMDEAPVGITIADATKPDMPLVYANAAFERITGYPPSYAVGRNCRFLQGEATREEPVARMRAAIERDEATTVEVRNYRRDGELFWNEVTIAPLRDESGTVVNYVGFQQDVTRRKRAERAAKQRAARIERERTAQRRLLQRLDGVVVDVTEAVTEATSRRQLEVDVVDRIDRTYGGTWIGRYDPRAREIAVSAAKGATAGICRDDRLSLDDADGLTAATVAAGIEDRYVRTASLDDADEETAVAAIPLHYGDVIYGAIGVYICADDGFASDEHAVLTALGRAVATGLNAIESQRTLREEEAFRLRFSVSDHALVDLAADADCRLEYRGFVGDRDRRSTLYEASAEEGTLDVDRIRAAGSESLTVHSVLPTHGESAVLELSVEDGRLRTALSEHGAELESVTVDGDRAVVAVAVAREALAQSLAETITGRFEHAELIGYRHRDDRNRTRHEFVTDVERDLTDRQHDALVRAFSAGYFDWPRDVDGDELAGSMGVCRSTFHQHLRAAEKKLVAAFVGPDRLDPVTGTGDPN